MLEVDVDHQINAVQRKVGTKTIETGQADVVTISQAYDTDVADLWDAVTSVERIPAMVPADLWRPRRSAVPISWKATPAEPS